MPARRRRSTGPDSITKLTVKGFKSLRQQQHIDIRPLTIIAGVNSSGKSSMIQPLLLLKQTIEAPYDPGPLLLDGPNVSITKIEQVLSREQNLAKAEKDFTIDFALSSGEEIQLRFGRAPSGDVRLRSFVTNPEGPNRIALSEGMSQNEIRAAIPINIRQDVQDLFENLFKQAHENVEPSWNITRNRWLLSANVTSASGRLEGVNLSVIRNQDQFENVVARIIHLPALRGNPRRTYRTAAVEQKYPGVFNDYTAGIIAAWQNRKQNYLIAQLRADLEHLGLTWKVEARQLDDTSVELLVGRLPHAQQGGARDLVNIADVGFGVSQTLPVVVALIVAAPGQLLYLEQPEIHLHPRAQAAFADLLQAAVDRGAKVLVETHSALLIRAIQTLVANGKLKSDDVALHWFSRDATRGWTTVTSATLDRLGSFGDWPEDFDEVTLKADHDYLTAAEAAEVTAK